MTAAAQETCPRASGEQAPQRVGPHSLRGLSPPTPKAAGAPVPRLMRATGWEPHGEMERADEQGNLVPVGLRRPDSYLRELRSPREAGALWPLSPQGPSSPSARVIPPHIPTRLAPLPPSSLYLKGIFSGKQSLTTPLKIANTTPQHSLSLFPALFLSINSSSSILCFIVYL